MKVRQGFVSNSSSSSFLIYGVFIEDSQLPEEFDKYGFTEGKPDFKDWMVSDGPDGCDGMYIGKSWDSIKDDQTGKQFKEEIQQVIDKYFKGTECSSHEASWYNG